MSTSPAVNLAKDLAKSSKPEAPKPAIKVKTIFVPLFDKTPTGSELFNYNEAIMQVLGMNSIKRNSVKMGSYLSFYNTGSAVRHHVKNGNMEKLSNAMLRLTTKGLTFFAKRVIDGKVQKENVAKYVAIIKTGKALVKHHNKFIVKGLKFSKLDIKA